METHLAPLENRTLLPEPAAYVVPAGHRASAGGYPAAQEMELEFHEVGAALLRRRYVILAFALLGLLGGLFAAQRTKRTYIATATVEFAQPNNHALGLDDPSSSASDLSTLELLNTELKTQQTEITDDATALAVIEKLRLDTQAPFAIPSGAKAGDRLRHERGLPLDQAPYQRERVIKLFERNLGVDVVKGTRLLNISYTDTDPVRAAAIANAVVTASLDQTSGRHSASFNQVTSWLGDQLQSLKQRVEDSQKRAEQYENENQRDLAGMTLAANGSGGLGGQADTVGASQSVPVSRLLTLNSELTNAEVARIAKEAIYRVAQSGDPDAVLSIGTSSLIVGGGADSALAPGNGGLALLQRLREQQVQLNVQLATASTKYGPKNQVMLEGNRQAASLAEQMTVELGRIRARAKSDLDLATRAENGLREKVTTQQGEVSQWTTKADHLLLLQGEAASSRTLYQDLFAKLEESQFAAGMRASHLALLDAARVPTVAAGPNKRNDLALGCLAGVVLGLISALLLELLDDSLHSEEQVRKAFGAPVLGAIPSFPRGSNEAKPWVLFDPRSRTAEAYRALRTATFAGQTMSSCKVLLVASARPAEGKATTCLNAAAALAVQGHRVLILNADMRRAGADEHFGVKTGGGLSRCLMGHISADEAVQPSGALENLYVLPAGPVPENPSELLSSVRFSTLLCELRLRFEYILIDSPPALLFTDTRIISSAADGYVLVVKASRTPKADLRKTLDNLYGSGGAFLGVVFNGAREKAPRYAKFGYGA